MREALWLTKNGIPFDVAFALDDLTRVAWCIAMSEMEGAIFDWGAMKWRERDG